MKRLLGIAGVLIALVALVAVAARELGTPHPTEMRVEEGVVIAPEAADELADPAELDTSVPQGVAPGPSSPPVATERVAPARPSFAGRVLDGAGVPVAGATVSWTPAGDAPADPAARAAWLLERSVLASTDEEGRFAFSSPPSPAGGESVVWITHTAFEAASVHLGADPSRWVRGDHALRHAPPARASVTEGSAPAAGATVTWVGAAEEPSDPAFWLARSATTGGDGEVSLHPAGADVLAWARRGALASPPWRGKPAGLVRLELRPTFALAGAIARAPGLDGRPLALTVTLEAGVRTTALCRLEGELERFGPLDLPLVEDEDYVARLEGDGVVPVEERFRVDARRPSHRLDLTASAGTALWFFVGHTRDDPIPGAELSVSWPVDGGRVRRGMRTRDDGYAYLEGIPDAWITATASAPGYVPFTGNPLLVSEAASLTQVIVLQRGATLRGRCLHRGEPVRDFELVVWPSSLQAGPQQHRVTGSADGSFVLESAPLGHLAAVAHAPGIGTSPPAVAEVREGAGGELELSIPDGAVARGRVVSAVTGEPLAGARIVQVVLQSGALLGELATEARSAEDGAFELRDVAPGEARIRVLAAGWSPAELTAYPQGDGVAELGEVRLTPLQSLSLFVVTGPDSVVPAGPVFVTDRPEIPTARFGGAGRIDYGPVEAGSYTFRTYLPDDSELCLLAELRPGGSWTLPFDVSPSTRVAIRVEPADELPPGSLVSLYSAAGDDLWLVRSGALDEQGRAAFPNVPTGPLEVLVTESVARSRVVLAKRVTAVEGGEQTIVVRLGEGDRSVRVVDGRGRPVAGASVAAYSPADDRLASAQLTTDADGLCELRGLDYDSVELYVAHEELGHRYAVPFRPRAADPDEPFEVVLDARVDVQVVLTGKRGFVGGLQPSLSDARGLFPLAGAFSDERGQVAWRRLSEGDYFVHLDHPDHWPVWQPFRATEGMGPVMVPTRRRCDFALRVTLAGLPLARHPVELVYVDANRPAAELLTDERASASSGSLATDTRGVLALTGFPEGEYRWTVELASGPASGSFVAEWGGEDSFAIAIP